MFCKKCGKQFPEGSVFCPYCGEKLSPVVENKESVKQEMVSETQIEVQPLKAEPVIKKKMIMPGGLLEGLKRKPGTKAGMIAKIVAGVLTVSVLGVAVAVSAGGEDKKTEPNGYTSTKEPTAGITRKPTIKPTETPKKANFTSNGKVLNIYSWNDEFQTRVEDYYPGYVKVDSSTGKIGRVTVQWHLIADSTGEYQEEIDEKLKKQSVTSADEKIDMFLVEADYALKYVDTDYTLSVSELGISAFDLLGQYSYTKEIMKDSAGNIKGVTWQACPGAMFYNRSAAKKIFGTDDPKKIQNYVKDRESFLEAAEKVASYGYKMTASIYDTYRVYSTNVTEKWVDGRKISLDTNCLQWAVDAKNMVEAGQTGLAGLWSDVWNEGFYPDGKVFCYFGPAWLINNSMAADVKGSIANSGGWAATEGPQAFFWGGTWICAAAGTDNGSLIKDIMLQLTTNKEIMMDIVKQDDDFVNNKYAMEAMATDSSYKSKVLGGQNPLSIYCAGAEKIDMNCCSAQDQICNAIFQEIMYEYIKGNISFEEAQRTVLDRIAASCLSGKGIYQDTGIVSEPKGNGKIVAASSANKPKATPKPAASNTKATATPKPTSKPKATATPKISAGTYTVQDSFGEETLSAKKGFANTVRRKEPCWGIQEEKGIKLYIQDLETWSDGALLRSDRSEIDDKGAVEYTYKFVDDYEEDLVLEYLDYLEKYDLSLGKKHKSRTFSNDFVWQGLSYSGKKAISEGTTGNSLIGDVDAMVTYEKGGTVFLNLPKEMSVKDFGDRVGGKKVKTGQIDKYTNKSAVSAEIRSNGMIRYTVTGWNEVSGDSILIEFHPDSYEKGDVFTLKDYKSQVNNGTGALYHFYVWSEEVGRKDIMTGWSSLNYWEAKGENEDNFRDIQVTVLDKTDTVTAIQFMVKVVGTGGDLYTIEGVFAADTEGVYMADTGGSSTGSFGTSGGGINSGIANISNTRRCALCNGSGNAKCISCGGDGWKMCTVCHGTGTNYQYGQKTNCSCRNGQRRCTGCGGDGQERCTGCGGDGMY